MVRVFPETEPPPPLESLPPQALTTTAGTTRHATTRKLRDFNVYPLVLSFAIPIRYHRHPTGNVKADCGLVGHRGVNRCPHFDLPVDD